MDPLLPLGPLPSHVKHVKGQISELKLYLHNSGRFYSSSQHILKLDPIQCVDLILGSTNLIGRLEVVGSDAFDVRQKVSGRVVELELGSSLVAQLDGRVVPEVVDGTDHVRGGLVPGVGMIDGETEDLQFNFKIDLYVELKHFISP